MKNVDAVSWKVTNKSYDHVGDAMVVRLRFGSDSHGDLARGDPASGQSPLLLQQGEYSVGRHDRCVVDGEVFQPVLDDFPRLGLQAVHADTVYVQWSPERHLGHEDGVPRHADRGPGKVVNLSVLDPVPFRLEPKVDELLQKLDGALVVFNSCELNTRGIHHGYFLVINAVI